MTIGARKTFGQNAPAQQGEAQVEKIPAKFWLNFGYTVQVPDEENGGMKAEFIGLPNGIALDTQKELPLNGRNQNYLNILDAKNGLLRDVLKECETLEAGEMRVILEDITSGLQVTIRRVKDKVEPSAPVENVFRRNVFGRGE